MSNSKNNKRLGVKYFSSFILIFSLTTWLSADFSKNGDVVRDSKTGLEWQDNSDTNGTERTWQEAIDYCEVLDLDGHSDWRLPNINELKSIIDRSKSNPVIVDGFENIHSGYYWSLNTQSSTDYFSWFVDFYNGYVYGDNKHINCYVRCVRAGE